MPRKGYGGYGGYSSPSAVSELLMEGGRQRAEGAARIGDILAGTAGQVGEQLGGYFEKRKTERETKAREEALSKRDAAISAAFEESFDDPETLRKRLFKTTDPKTAMDLYKGAIGMQNLSAAPDPVTAAKETVPLARGFKAASFGLRSRLYPGLRELLVQKGVAKPEELPDSYDLDTQQQVDELMGYVLAQQEPEKGAVVGKALVDPTTGAVRYQAPEDRKAPETQHETFGGKVHERALDPVTGQWGEWKPLGASEGALGRAAQAAKAAGAGAISEAIMEDIGRLPDDWRNWDASRVTRDSFSVRKNEQAQAIARANAGGKILPTKIQGAAIIAAKSTLSDINQARQLLADPEVQAAVGRYAGNVTNFLSKGWADPFGGEKAVSPKVRQFRAALNRLAAEERHRIYGSALTNIESNYAEGFIPGIEQSGATVGASLDEFASDIERGMDAMWGGRGRAEAPGGAQPRRSLGTRGGYQIEIEE